MKIDLVMCCYNNDKFISDAIESVISQSSNGWNLWIVDDSSNDNSWNIIDSYFNKNKSIKGIYKNSKNMGYGYSLRLCISFGINELIGIIDGDDVLEKTAVEEVINFHSIHPNASMIYSKYRDFSDNIEKSWKPRCEFRKLDNDETFLNLKKKTRISHFKTYKRLFYNKTSGVDKNLVKCVDKDLTLKMEEVGDIIFLDKSLYFYRNHKNQLTYSAIKKYGNIKIESIRKKIYEEAKKRRGLV